MTRTANVPGPQPRVSMKVDKDERLDTPQTAHAKAAPKSADGRWLCRTHALEMQLLTVDALESVTLLTLQ